MPDAGFDSDGGGWLTDWFRAGKGGPPKWETHHIGELIPFVDRNLRTLGRGPVPRSTGSHKAASAR